MDTARRPVSVPGRADWPADRRSSSYCPAIQLIAAASETRRAPFFSPLSAAAVNDKAVMANLNTGHVQTLMDQPECMSGHQSFPHLGPEGEKLSGFSRASVSTGETGRLSDGAAFSIQITAQNRVFWHSNAKNVRR
jgi:hypothetical protein